MTCRDNHSVFTEYIVSYWRVRKYKNKTFRDFQVLNLIIINQQDFKELGLYVMFYCLIRRWKRNWIDSTDRSKIRIKRRSFEGFSFKQTKQAEGRRDVAALNDDFCFDTYKMFFVSRMKEEEEEGRSFQTNHVIHSPKLYLNSGRDVDTVNTHATFNIIVQYHFQGYQSIYR